MYSCRSCTSEIDLVDLVSRQIDKCPKCQHPIMSVGAMPPSSEPEADPIKFEGWGNGEKPGGQPYGRKPDSPPISKGEEMAVVPPDPTPAVKRDMRLSLDPLSSPILRLPVDNHEDWGLPPEICVDVDWFSTVLTEYDAEHWPREPGTDEPRKTWKMTSDYLAGLARKLSDSVVAWSSADRTPVGFSVGLAWKLRDVVNQYIESAKNG